MADVQRTRTQIISDWADNVTGAITPQVGRNTLVSMFSVVPIVEKTSGGTYTAVIDDTVILVSQDADFTVNLPTASTANLIGKLYYIKKLSSSARTLTIDGYGSETIDGYGTYQIIGQYNSATLVCDGTKWHVV